MEDTQRILEKKALAKVRKLVDIAEEADARQANSTKLVAVSFGVALAIVACIVIASYVSRAFAPNVTKTPAQIAQAHRVDYVASVQERVAQAAKSTYWQKVSGHGSAEVTFMINAGGHPHEISVVRSSANPDIDEAAVESVRLADPFGRPPEQDSGKPLRIRTLVTVGRT
jgi:TonB family protein